MGGLGMRACAYGLTLASVTALTGYQYYTIDTQQTAQTIWGLGYEIQSDSIGSGNHGLPVSNTSVPNDLVDSEKQRFFTEMLQGFRYCRLALGLYFRGLDASQQHIVERWPGQAAGLAQMAAVSGIEGFDVEYWSPAPAWKDTQAYIDGSLASFNTSFLSSFAQAVVTDIDYLESNGMHVVQWGLQNEPPVGPQGCIYSCCGYTPEQYTQTFAVVAPAVKTAYPSITLHADSWGGQSHASAIAGNATLRQWVDGWTWHCVGCDSNSQIGGGVYAQGAYGLPVWNNEFEYLSGITDFNATFVNTAQSIMNWFVFVDSPTWYWLHALKPTYNSEALGYGLGFWRPWDDNDFNATHFPDLPYGHWTYNPVNWNAVAGFVKYLPWDSVRVVVDEVGGLFEDARILAYAYNASQARWIDQGAVDGAGASANASLLAIVLSNRHNTSFTFNIDVTAGGGGCAQGQAQTTASDHLSPTPSASALSFTGHGYTLAAADAPLGTIQAACNATSGAVQMSVTLPPFAVQFWLQDPATSVKGSVAA